MDKKAITVEKPIIEVNKVGYFAIASALAGVMGGGWVMHAIDVSTVGSGLIAKQTPITAPADSGKGPAPKAQ